MTVNKSLCKPPAYHAAPPGNPPPPTASPIPHSLFFLCIFIFLTAPLPAQTASLRMAAIPENPRPGEPVTVAVTGIEGANLRAALVNAQGRLSRAGLFSLAAEAGELPVRAAVLAVPATARPGAALIRIEGDGGVLGELAIVIGDRDFVSEEIALDAANTAIRTEPDPQKTAESEHLWTILSHTGTDIYAHGPFTPPVTATRRTSFFGDRRVFRYSNGSSDTSIHAGIDYGVPLGTPVTACAPGKVILARFRIVTGNSVILEHLPGVYSLYYHLDKIEAAEGTMAAGGSLLGHSGSTGLSTGPHLHWEIRVAGENTDPDAFISRPILDKEALLSKIDGEVPAPPLRGTPRTSYGRRLPGLPDKFGSPPAAASH